MPDVRGWDRLSANPGQDIINVVRQLAAQAGLYMIYSPHQKGKSDHVADLSGRGWHVAAYTSDEHVYHSPYVLFDSDLDSADPTVETPQTKADILAWKKKQGKGPAKNWFTKRGR
jgi:hypothetical protein